MAREAWQATVHGIAESNMTGKLTEKRKKVKFSQLLSNSLWCHRLNWILQARILERAAIPLSRDHPNPGFELRSSQPRHQTQVSQFQVDSLPAKPQGKPKNTGVDSLSLMQWTFPTQELNLGFLHCRQILY